MTQTLIRTTTEEGSLPLTIRLKPSIKMTEEQFGAFCELNKDVRIERTAGGELELMPPVYSETGAKELEIGSDLRNWARASGSGVAFGSNAGFTLPNGAMRSPDASWVSPARISALSREEKQGFISVCPDFVVELRSTTDRMSVLQAKMEEYMANGARLGWLLDPLERRAYVYRSEAQVKVLENVEILSADPELPGFILNLTRIWEPAF